MTGGVNAGTKAGGTSLTVTVAVAVPVPPKPSLTVKLTVNVPTDRYVWMGATPVAVSRSPDDQLWPEQAPLGIELPVERDGNPGPGYVELW